MVDIEQFQNELFELDEESKLVQFCRRYILHGTPSVFKDREREYYEFRETIASHFKINFFEVLIVGSAMLGFSFHKRTPFTLESDIDVAIVSSELFEHVMDKILSYQFSLRENRVSITKAEIDMYHSFLEYVSLGWIRPDKLPRSFNISKFKEEWFQFFEGLSYGKSTVGNYKVTAGVFKSFRHLEKYTLSNIEKLRANLEIEKI